MAADPAALSPEDVALLERVAARVVELRLEVPALLTLESVRPLARLARQALAFFQPFAQALFTIPEYDRFAALLERPAALDRLVERVGALADEARAAGRPPRGTPPR